MEGRAYYNGTGSSMRSDVNWHRLSQTLSSDIQKFSQNVLSIKKMVEQLGTQRDRPEFREKLHQIQHYTGQLAKDISANLQAFKDTTPLPSEQHQWKMQKERLTNEFMPALTSFQETQRSAALKEKEEVKRVRTAAGFDSFPGPKHEEQLVDFGGQRHTQIQMQEDLDLEQLQNRESAIRQLEDDIVNVNQIFRDLATMVHEQGEMVDSIEANVESSQVHVSEAASKIEHASRYQTKARKKKCCLFVILAVVLAIITGIIVWQTQ